MAGQFSKPFYVPGIIYVNNNPLGRLKCHPRYTAGDTTPKWEGGEYFVHHGGSGVGAEVGIEAC